MCFRVFDSRFGRAFGAILSFTFLITTAVSSRADTVIDTFADWDGNITAGWQATAQTITVPADNVLSEYRFQIAPRPTPGNLNFEVYAWANGPVGAALFTQTIPWDAGGIVDVNGIDLPLVSGNLYGMVVDLLGSGGNQSVYYQTNQISYSGGNGWWFNDGLGWDDFSSYNHRFRAVFTGVPEPTSLLLILVGLGLVAGSQRARQV